VRLDHLLSKECHRPFSSADHYPVEHWLFGCSRTPADGCGRLRRSCFAHFANRRSPPSTDRSLRKPPDSRYFVLRERPFRGFVFPGDVFFGLDAGSRPLSGPGRALRELPGLRSTVPMRRVPAEDRSPRACPGRAAVLTSSPLAYSGDRVGMSDLVRALCSPLRIPKRARASLFSKLQRANGGCLGA
jgi:hypothetical protein